MNVAGYWWISRVQSACASCSKSLTWLAADNDSKIDIVKYVAECTPWAIIQFPCIQFVNYITCWTIVVWYPQDTILCRWSQPNPDNHDGHRLIERCSKRRCQLSQTLLHGQECTKSGECCPWSMRISEETAHFSMSNRVKYDLRYCRSTVPYTQWAARVWGSYSTQNGVYATPVHHDPFVHANYS